MGASTARNEAPRRLGQPFVALALLAWAGTAPITAQPAGKIDLRRMRPTGLLVDPYSYMSPPHNAYYFHHIDRLGFRTDRVKRSGPVTPLVTSTRSVEPRYSFEGREIGLAEYLTRNQVTGFLVLAQDSVLVERYLHGSNRASRFVSQSVGKSVVSILVGIAFEEGKLKSVDDRVVDYLPELAESGYRDVTIKNALQMATGVGYSEDYRDSTSGAARIGQALVTGEPQFFEFVRSMRPTAVRPGTAFEYQSVNTQLLGELLERVTGMSLSRWAQQTLWSRLGAESDAFFYQAKPQRSTCAFACFNATLRDYGRIGLMMLRGGALGGRRIVSEEWVRQSTAPHVDPTAPTTTPRRPPFGYGYQWWLPPNPDGAFMAIGIYGQAIYVNPARGVVVVQTSAWPTPLGDGTFGEERALMFDAVAKAAGR
jgi:CubicO group peptidase (beta-lactamase class C family)